MSVTFCPIASSSSGNCVFVGASGTNILIDAGLSLKAILKGLTEIGTEGSAIDAIFITHEHTDHIKGAGIIARRFNVPIFATPKTWDEINTYNLIGNVPAPLKHCVYPGERLLFGEMALHPFAIPHDAAEPVGYCITVGDVSLAVATDMGYVTDAIEEALYNTDAIVLESNHDVTMLKNGRYPRYLKERILGKYGHLSNASAGEYLARAGKKLKHVFLGHLSSENNHPLVAYNTVAEILMDNGITPGKDFALTLAERQAVSPAFVL